MKPDTDIAIVGAGCAGLSLGVALGQAGVRERVCLLEPRTSYGRDRTWCFWDTETHPFAAAITHRWSKWRVSAGGREATQTGGRYRYCHVAGDRFYDVALAQIGVQKNQELSTGISVESIAPHASGNLAVETSAGRMLARQVFDSRPPFVSAAPTLLQRFTGWHIRTAEACFNPETVELMQFMPSGDAGRVRFVYVLPYSQTEALVEMTYLDQPQLASPDAEAELRVWLGANVCGEYAVLYAERGCLPMGIGLAEEETLGGRLHSIGTRGGRLKPSSGYGFLRIQRHSHAIAQAVRAGRAIPQRAEARIYGALDAVFLRALEMRVVAPEELFLRMFAGTDPDRLVRFLSESSGLLEMARVAWCLPKRAMLRAALARGPRAELVSGAEMSR